MTQQNTFTYHKMMQKNIAVIGGGISSLSLALYMAQQIYLK